ncbi:MAG: hypothetical protein HY685_00890 [Chloroflexi bacterium]|nr:hypothetical protein [Chloroflexota bacterium]
MSGRARPGNSTRYAFLGLFLVALAAFIAYTLFSSVVPRDQGGSLAAAPDVSFPTLDGDFRLSEQRGKVVALHFSFPG